MRRHRRLDHHRLVHDDGPEHDLSVRFAPTRRPSVLIEPHPARLARAMERLREALAAIDDEHQFDPENHEQVDALRHAATTIENVILPILTGAPR
jgi:uncharacterized membrane protein YccC